MALINRISRLFQADMHAVLDQIEEPEILLRQAIRDMQETLAQHQSQIQLAKYEQQQLVKTEGELKQVLTELDEQLVICFKSDKDELAHGLVKRKLHIKQGLKTLAGKQSSLVENSNRLSTKLREHQSQLDSMQQKADILGRHKSSNTTFDQWGVEAFSITDEDIEVAFLQEKQNWARS